MSQKTDLKDTSCELSLCDVKLFLRDDGRKWLLGKGGFGKVYKASMEKGRLVVAVKVLNESFQSEAYLLKREMQLLARVQSPYVTQFIGAIFGPKMMLVMEFLEGGSLYESLAQTDPTICENDIFSWYKRGRRIATEIAMGLCAIHKEKIIHFDVKSPNVLLAADLTAKVADLGMAKVLQHSATIAHDPGFHPPPWRAPEHMLGLRCSPKADVYSFGVVLWEIVTGDRAFRGQIYDAAVPQQCPQAVWELILECLEVEPSRRPSSAQVLSRLLELDPQGPEWHLSVYHCPLTGEVMKDPVTLAETGIVYERANIEQWFHPRPGLPQRSFCPSTGKQVCSRTLVPNALLKQAIAQWPAHEKMQVYGSPSSAGDCLVQLPI